MGVGLSCGSVRTVCGPDTCSGCCKADGSCASAPANTDPQTCGRGGDSCVNCAASNQVCIDAVCTQTSGTGGGTVGCGPGTCGGCCSGTSRDSVCITATSNNNCGRDGLVCQSCGSGKECKGGTCVEVGAKIVGLACQLDADCEDLGPGAMCRTKTSSGYDTYSQGYCTLDCTQDTQVCPQGSTCVQVSPAFGESPALCLDLCDGHSDGCRSPGYACYALTSGTSNACWIDPLPQGHPADKVGAACLVDPQCQNPPLDGFCLSGTGEDGGSSAWPGGYCTAPCLDDRHCSADGGAVCLSLGSPVGACFQSCPAPGGGQSSCRQGYLCQFIFDDGVPTDGGACAPDCRNEAGLCGMKTCNANGYCQ